MDDSQLLKGILEGCVVSIIRRGETYGYEILAELEKEGFTNLMEGTLYPLLLRLEKKGLIHCCPRKSPMGPTRKYYTISKEGEAWFLNFQKSYTQITTCAHHIIFEKE